MSDRVPIRTLRPLDRCTINGYLCEVTRQARRTTFVRILDERLPGRCVVQLDKKIPTGELLNVSRAGR